MGSKKISTTIYITEEQNSLLKELNRRTKVPVSEYIREGIDLVLERYKDVLPGQLELNQYQKNR
jgi:predicted DNA-binding protein